MPQSEVTRLSPSEESRFQAWVKRNQITDVDHPNSHYDYRGYWKEFGDKPVRFGVDHFTDTYKQHGHPTFSEESKYSRGPGDGGTWKGDTFMPSKQVTPLRVPLAALKMVSVEELTPVDETVTKPHPEATIGPVKGDDTAPVTIGDLIDNPSLAIQRMVSITKQALTDPRVIIPAAVGLGLGGLARAADRMPALPSPMNAVRGAAGKLAGANPEAVADAVGILSPRTGAAVRTAARVAGKLAPKPEPAAPPVEAAPAPSPTPAEPPPTVPTQVRTSTKPTATSAKTSPVEEGESLPSLDELKLTPAEITTAVKWYEQGVSPEMIVHRILQSRQLTARTKTTTPDQAAEAVRYRNEKGRWQDER